MSVNDYLVAERKRIVSEYLKKQTVASWRAMRREISKLERQFPSSVKKPKEKVARTPASTFTDKWGTPPPELSYQELQELLAKRSWGSERSENYDSDTIDYYRSIGRIK